MDRRNSILKFVSKSSLGIEIGPWFNPIAPKREGFNCLVLDVFDTEELKRRAAVDNPTRSLAEIEDVDLVGSSTHIDEIVAKKYELGTFDYVLSSHNFEHLANPIRFLQGCARVLKTGGMVSMAIPDHRACFDFFRPVTMLSDWLAAYVEQREQPSLIQNFDHRAFFAYYDDGKDRHTSFPRQWPVDPVVGPSNLGDAYAELMQRLKAPDNEYLDSHCSVFTPSSFRLLMADCAYLGLAPFDVVEVFDDGCEFHAHLIRREADAAKDSAVHERERNALMQQIKDEEAEASRVYRKAIAERDELQAALDAEKLTHRQALERTRHLEHLSSAPRYQQAIYRHVAPPLRWCARQVRRLRSA